MARFIGEDILSLIDQPLSLGFDCSPNTLALCGDPHLRSGLLGHDHIHGFPTAGFLGFLRSRHFLCGFDRPCTGNVGLSRSGAFLKRFLIKRDRLFH